MAVTKTAKSKLVNKIALYYVIGNVCLRTQQVSIYIGGIMGSEQPKTSWPIIIGGVVLSVCAIVVSLYIQQVRQELVKTKAELASAQEDERRLTEQLNQANTKLARKPDLPVSVSLRQAMMGPGLVAQFKNNSERFLSIAATFHNPTTNESMTTRLDLAPGTVKEIGHMEGWTFSSGDSVVLENNDYTSLNTIIQ